MIPVITLQSDVHAKLVLSAGGDQKYNKQRNGKFMLVALEFSRSGLPRERESASAYGGHTYN